MLFTFFFALFSIHTSASSVYYSSPTFYTESYSSLLYYSFSNTVTVPQQYPNPWFSQRMRFTVLNLSPESTYADPQGCYSTSSVVQLKIFKNNTFETVTYGCTADDILNSTKRDTLQSQLSTAVDHFSSLYGFGAKPLELSTTPAALNVCGKCYTPIPCFFFACFIDFNLFQGCQAPHCHLVYWMDQIQSYL